MSRQMLYTCDRCGAETAEDDMEDVWQPYKISTDEGDLCPDCYAIVREGMMELLNSHNDEDVDGSVEQLVWIHYLQGFKAGENAESPPERTREAVREQFEQFWEQHYESDS